MPPNGSPYPWRTANDADFDITGHMLPQGAYRSVVWGSKKTHLFSMHPDTFAVFFPGDAHAPTLALNEVKPVKKVVIKVPV